MNSHTMIGAPLQKKTFKIRVQAIHPQKFLHTKVNISILGEEEHHIELGLIS